MLYRGLKILVSVVRFRPGPPKFKADCSQSAFSIMPLPRMTDGEDRISGMKKTKRDSAPRFDSLLAAFSC